MKLKLIYEWLGNPPGTIIDVKDAYAPTLIQRGCAVEYKEENGIKIQRRDKDKMVSNAENK